MNVRRIAEGLRRFRVAVMRAVQAVILNISLVVVFFMGLGLTKLFMSVLAPRKLRCAAAGWNDASGYDKETGDFHRQS